MNRIKYLLLVVFVLPLVTTAALAQEPVENEPALINQYLFDYDQIRNQSWWNALESQLILMMDKPLDQIDEKSIQNIIFFATHHSDKIDLHESVPKLIEVYRLHEVEGMRLMSAVALHAIGDRNGMRKLNLYARQQPDGPVKRMAMRALADYHAAG